MPHGNHQRPEIMNSTHKDGTEHHPQERRHPAPQYRNGGAHNRTGARNGGKMMAEQHSRFGGNIILAVRKGMGRRRVGRIERKYFSGQPATVSVIRDNKSEERRKGDNNGSHDPPSFPVPRLRYFALKRYMLFTLLFAGRYILNSGFLCRSRTLKCEQRTCFSPLLKNSPVL